MYPSLRRAMKQTVVIIGAFHFCQQRTKFMQHPAVKVNSIDRKLFGIIRVDFDATGQLLTIYSAFVKYLRRNGKTTKQCISSL